MGLIIVLVLLGLFFLVMELIFLPGAVFGTALSVVSYGAAVYLGFDRLGFGGGVVTIVVVLLLSLVVTVLSQPMKATKPPQWSPRHLQNPIYQSPNRLPRHS